MTRRPQSRSKIIEWLGQFAEDDLGILLADGFEGAFLGVAVRSSQPPVAVYDAGRCIEIIVMRDGATEEEATEVFEFNTLGAWMGDRSPLYLWRYKEAKSPSAGSGEG